MKTLLIVICMFLTSLIYSQNCGATTQKGTPCKNKVKVEGLHCWMHGGERKEAKPKGESKQCSAIATSTGKQCRKMTTDLSGKCFIHNR